MKELEDFVDEITLDCSSMPKDESEGFEDRDISLSELLHEDEWEDTDPCLDALIDCLGDIG